MEKIEIRVPKKEKWTKSKIDEILKEAQTILDDNKKSKKRKNCDG